MPRPLAIQPMFDGLDATAFKPKDGRDRPGLYLEECSYQAARYAVQHWHYSESFVGAGAICYGVWEDSRFIGVVIFSLPPAQKMCQTYNIAASELLELSRVALDRHRYEVSRIAAIAVRLIRRREPSLRVLVSYADEEQNHLGIIYQAMNWIYEGQTDTTGGWYAFDGVLIHGRSVYNRFGTRSINTVRRLFRGSVDLVSRQPKHKYSYPLDPTLRPFLERLRRPYPKCARSVDGGTSVSLTEGDGSNPILALQPVPAHSVLSDIGYDDYEVTDVTS